MKNHDNEELYKDITCNAYLKTICEICDVFISAIYIYDFMHPNFLSYDIFEPSLQRFSNRAVINPK